MKALARLGDTAIGRTTNWRFHHYGLDGKYVLEEAARCGITDRVVLHGWVPRNEALSAVRGARVAVVVASVAEEGALSERGWVPGKLYEPLGLGIPVLLIAPLGSDASKITKTTGLVRRYSASDLQGMVSFLEGCLRGHIPDMGNMDALEWSHLGSRYDVLLRGVI
jgi:glycosyltransferase involved in cell wall biosynthesis